MSGPRAGQFNVQILFCNFQRYLHCSQQAVSVRCGAASASFTQDYINRMSGDLVHQHCQHHQPGTQECRDLGLQRPRVVASSGAGNLAVRILLSSSFILRFF